MLFGLYLLIRKRAVLRYIRRLLRRTNGGQVAGYRLPAGP